MVVTVALAFLSLCHAPKSSPFFSWVTSIAAAPSLSCVSYAQFPIWYLFG